MVKTINNAQRAAYPRSLLKWCDSALILFASAYLGQNDGYAIEEAGIPEVVAVDLDPDTLSEMEAMYPASWAFVLADAFEFARVAAKEGRRWDVVSADLPANLVLEMLDALPLWRGVAQRFVVSTVMRHNFAGEPSIDELPDAPDGWEYRELIKRSDHRGGAYWLVQERLLFTR